MLDIVRDCDALGCSNSFDRRRRFMLNNEMVYFCGVGICASTTGVIIGIQLNHVVLLVLLGSIGNIGIF